MRVSMQSLLPLIFVPLLFCACTCATPPEGEQIQEQPEEAPEPAVPPPVEPQTEPEPTAPPPEPEAEAEQKPEEYVVSEEVYTKTFVEIEVFIQTLNEIIRNEDYDTWLTYLSDEYIERTGDQAYLRQQSEEPMLKKHGITLNSLRDYFIHVVVPSRVQAQLDEIEFIDENQVRAYAMIKNTRALHYLLVRKNDKWKIGVW